MHCSQACFLIQPLEGAESDDYEETPSTPTLTIERLFKTLRVLSIVQLASLFLYSVNLAANHVEAGGTCRLGLNHPSQHGEHDARQCPVLES